MKLIRSTKSTLKYTTKQKKEAISMLLLEYKSAVNQYIDLFWNDENLRVGNIKSSFLKKANTWLSSRARQCAAHEAYGMCKSSRDKEKSPLKSTSQKEMEEILGFNIFDIPVKPKHSGKKVDLSMNIIEIQEGSNSFDLWVRVSSLGTKGHVIPEFLIPIKQHKHFNNFLAKGWELSTTITLSKKEIQFSFSTETEKKKEKGIQVGLDVGMNCLLASSEEDMMGMEVKSLIQKIKRKRQGSKAWYRAKRELKQYFHEVVSKFFKKHPNLQTTFVENLKGIKQNSKNKKRTYYQFRKSLHHWNQGQLLDIIQSYTEINRVSFRRVNPFQTSITCPTLLGGCGRVEEKSRKSQSEFECLHCGLKGKADFFASLNILKNGLGLQVPTVLHSKRYKKT
ncbi:MAG: IS605 OrfB family transposase [bacterium]|jgi:IS605 OrfB family transposase